MLCLVAKQDCVRFQKASLKPNFNGFWLGSAFAARRPCRNEAPFIYPSSHVPSRVASLARPKANLEFS